MKTPNKMLGVLFYGKGVHMNKKKETINEIKSISHRVRDFVIGIDYDSNREDKGHMTLRRKVPIEELIEKIISITQNGSNYPQFPPQANPSITYAWDLSNQDDGDCYSEIINKLEQVTIKEVNSKCLPNT